MPARLSLPPGLVSASLVLLLLGAGVALTSCATTSKRPAEVSSPEPAPLPTPLEQDGLWGFIDADGQTVIPARFHRAEAFSSGGLAAVVDEQGWAYVDLQGDVLLRPHVVDNGPDPFQEGLARFIARGRYGFFDERGHIVVAPRFDFARPVSEGLAAVCMGCRLEAVGEHVAVVGGQWGYVEVGTELVHPIVWDEAGDFVGGVARARRLGVWSCFDRLRRDVPCPAAQTVPTRRRPGPPGSPR